MTDLERGPIDSKLMDKSSMRNKSYKPLVFGIGGIVVLALLAWGLLALGKFTHPNPTNNKTVAPKEVNLTPEQRQDLETQVVLAQDDINKLPAQASVADRFRAYRKLASAQHLLGKYDEALATLDKVAGENQNNDTLWSLYTNIYYDKGDLDKAKDAAKKALDLDKTVPEFWLAYIKASANDTTGVVKDLYQQALNNTTNNIGVITAYAQFLEKIGDKQGAIAQWQKAMEVFPQGRTDYAGEIARLQAQ